MDFTCANCLNRYCWDCEDYNWGYLDSKACKDNFELDIKTLGEKERKFIIELAKVLNE